MKDPATANAVIGDLCNVIVCNFKSNQTVAHLKQSLVCGLFVLWSD